MTITKYINNSSLIFDKYNDVDPETIEKTISLVPNMQGNKEKMRIRISDIIENWVLDFHNDITDIQGMQYVGCVRKIVEVFPAYLEFSEKIESLLEPMLKQFKPVCEELSSANIPAIVYKGEQNDLPEIFIRKNAQGTKLSKQSI